MGIVPRWQLLAAVLVGVACNGTGIARDSSSVDTGSAGIPIKSFVRPPDFSDVTISPDGKYLAAIEPSRDNPYKNLLVVLDGKTAKILLVIHSGPDQLVYRYFWVSNDRLIATLFIKHNGLDTPTPTGELFAINADGSHQINLFGYHTGTSDNFGTRGQRHYVFATPISTQSFDRDHILIAVNDFTSERDGSFTDIETLNVQNGASIHIGTSPARNARLMADHAGQVRVAYANNDYTGWLLWKRTSNNAPWVLANEPTWSGVNILPIGFNRDNSKLYVRVSQGDRPDAIELLDISSNQLTKIFQGQFADPGELLPTADHQDYYAVISEDGKPALHYLDDSRLETQLSKALAANFPDQLAYFSSFTHDGRHAIVHVTSDRDPGDFYLFDLDSHPAQPLLRAEPWIDPQQMRPMQPIELKTRDGLSLHGFLTLPAGDKPYPLIVLPHGGPNGIADTWGYDPEVQLFASRGYAVLQVNYRGSGGYGSRFQQRGYRQWGLSMQDDLTDATEWAIRQGYASPQRICIYGASYGGYAALEGAVREPDLYKCAIGYAGIYDLRVQMEQSDTQRTNMGDAYLHLILGDDLADLLSRSPLSGASRIKADILLLHGRDDLRVQFKNFKEFTKALDLYGKHYETLVEPHEGHGFFLPEHRQEAYQKMLDFLDRNIGAVSTTASAQPPTARVQ